MSCRYFKCRSIGMDPIFIQGSRKPDQFETIIEELLEVVKNINEWMMNYKFWKNNKNY